MLGTWRTGAHRYRVADAIDLVAIAITLAMLATNPTIAGCLHSRLCGYMKKISVYAVARLLLSAVGGIIYRRSLFVFSDGGLEGAAHLAHICAPTPCR